jgi:hypothetical protein
MRWLFVFLVACSSTPGTTTPPKPAGSPPAEAIDPSLLAPLPKAGAIDTDKFAGVGVCDRCHTAGALDGDTAKTMRNSAGVDISPVTEFLAGMMSLSARDPYYLAALRREIAANPGAKSTIEATCNRCHAPVGFAQMGKVTIEDLIANKADDAGLAREGVGCAGCHSLEPSGLGEEKSFTGAQPLRTDRVSFGSLPEPLAEVMVQMSKTTPKHGKHVAESELCASCHTVIVRRLDASGAPTGDPIHEQTTFLEWRNSAYIVSADGGRGERAKTCQGCHMPMSEDEAGNGREIQTPFATRPVDAPARNGYRRHALRGGNSYLLRRLAEFTDWLGAKAKPEDLRRAADATDQFMKTAAEILVESADAKQIKLTISNRAGHKLPTGYPTRRMWLHVVAKDAAGNVLLESGAHKDGALVDRAGKRIDGPGVILPHRQTLDGPDQVMVWEAVPVDEKGKRTHLLLGTASIVKDNRILPMGWKKDHRDAARTQAIGVGDDRDFDVGGQDSIHIKLPPGVKSVSFELLYQPIPPETIDSYQKSDGKEAARFLAIVAVPPAPVVIATKSINL